MPVDRGSAGETDPYARKRHPALFRAVQRRRNPKLRRSDITVTDTHSVKRAVKAAALGNAMEWFDFGIYSYLAVTIGHVFFPGGSGTTQLLSSFATFAVAFVVRPLGGSFFGPLGDRIGRKKVLAATILLMATGTFCVGLIPSYASIGLWAPVLLIFFRLVQGFSTGGEYGGASTFMAEYAPDRRRGFFCSFLEFGTLAGYVAAASLVAGLRAWLGPDTMDAWGWRIPFLVGGPLGLVGLYLRMRLEETPAFQRLEASKTNVPEAAETAAQPHEQEQEQFAHLSENAPRKAFGRIFAEHWPRLLLCVCLVGAYNITDYMLLSYMPTYVTDQLHYKESHGLLVLIGVMIALMAVISQVGRLNDHYGRKPLLMAGMLGFVVLSLPAFLLVRQGSLLAVIAGMGMLGLCLVCLLSTMSAALPALFPTDVRYGSLSISYNLAVSIFGGTTPLVITALIDTTGNPLMPAYYTMAAALIGVVAVALMTETARRPLEGSPPSVTTKEEAARLVSSQAQQPTF
ncbi:MFS transporter [Streptomyces sp. TP-A0874]|uniref:MFS transporter n=1 Tax=Streptomyces sp. TP-A0874 TaxID=549819 RepID=UPI0008538AD3|nr:MFS transporter [Streptomyces sp. TP-A0874]